MSLLGIVSGIWTLGKAVQQAAETANQGATDTTQPTKTGYNSLLSALQKGNLGEARQLVERLQQQNGNDNQGTLTQDFQRILQHIHDQDQKGALQAYWQLQANLQDQSARLAGRINLRA